MSAAATSSLIACPECDALYAAPRLPVGMRANCGRCGARLFANKPRTVQRTLALNLAALVFFILCLSLPFLTVQVQGQSLVAGILAAVQAYQRAGMPEIAVIVFFFILGAPALMILANLYVLLPLSLGRRLPFATHAMRLVEEMREWAMPEVFLLGVLVSFVKVSAMAALQFDAAAACFVAMVIALIWGQVALEPRDVWEMLSPAPAQPLPPAAERRHLVACHACGLVSHVDPTAAAHGARCPRCQAALHKRHRNSVARAWALVLTAIILYIPANVLPVMMFSSLGSPPQADTILSGVVELINYGDIPIAVLIFFASITVPMAKLLGLMYLLVSVQRRSRFRPKDRTRLYRVVAAIGRWSMVDVFVVAILAALVQFGSLASIDPDVGVIAFCGVVVTTMFAALAFDPRLIWDAAGANDGR